MNKHPFLFLTFLLGITLIFSSCRYEEGPLLTLKSPESRIAQKWVVVAATDEDGNDNTDSYNNWTFIFEEDGTAKLTYPILGSDIVLNGDWNFVDGKDNLQILLSDPTGLVNFSEELVINKLTQNELRLENPDDDDQTIYLEPTP
jgi:hypothetical protein